MSEENSDSVNDADTNHETIETSTNERRVEDDATDNWELWSKIHSNRYVRLKLLCRDPNDRTSIGSACVVIRKLPLEVTKEQIANLFKKAGGVKWVYFPKIAPHFTTKYCFLTFHDFRQAERARTFFDGYRWGRDRLQVINYDACYKYRRTVTDRENIEGCNVVFNAIRQAEAQCESRKWRFEKAPGTSRRSVLGVVDDQVVGDMGNSDEEKSDFEMGNSDEEKSDFEMPQTTSSAALLEAERHRYLYHECHTVDDVLLDSEIGFLNWLEGRLKFAGPVHFTDQVMNGALRKTPWSVQIMFTWLLGAFRCLNDGRRFKLVGPFVCLPRHARYAEEKCIGLELESDGWYKEDWEPVAPNQIRSIKGLMNYVHRMLKRFGPLRLDDIKFHQLLFVLLVSRTNKEGNRSSDNDVSSLAKRLIQRLSRCTEFRVVDGVLFSVVAHYDILLFKSLR